MKRADRKRICMKGIMASLAMISAALWFSEVNAEDGIVLPDSARVGFSYSVNAETVTVAIQNLSSDPVEHCFLSDFTLAWPEFIGGEIDGLAIESMPTERETGQVYPDRFTTRWLVGSFSESLILRYYCAGCDAHLVSWSAGHPFAIFGFSSNAHPIGPPRNLRWHE
jgi:hypothetical protein